MEENRPVIVGGLSAATLISLFEAVLVLGRVSGWWDLNDDQTQAWLTVARIGFPVLVIFLTTWWTSGRTTSLARPTDEDGTRLVRSSDKTPAKQEVRSIERALRKR